MIFPFRRHGDAEHGNFLKPTSQQRTKGFCQVFERRNLSLAISVCASRLSFRSSNPVAISRAAMGVLLSPPPPTPYPPPPPPSHVISRMAAFWIVSSLPRLVLLTRLRIRSAYFMADLTKVTHKVFFFFLSDGRVAPQSVPSNFFISPIRSRTQITNCST